MAEPEAVCFGGDPQAPSTNPAPYSLGDSQSAVTMEVTPTGTPKTNPDDIAAKDLKAPTVSGVSSGLKSIKE